MIENKNDKFKRIAEKRINKVLKDIKILGNLSNKSHYKYEKDEVNRIFTAIEKELNNVKMKFKTETEEIKFKF